MLAAELMYFDGAPLAHVVAYEDHKREQRRAKLIRSHLREQRQGSRAYA
jgi:hypothetical protein